MPRGSPRSGRCRDADRYRVQLCRRDESSATARRMRPAQRRSPTTSAFNGRQAASRQVQRSTRTAVVSWSPQATAGARLKATSRGISCVVRPRQRPLATRHEGCREPCHASAARSVARHQGDDPRIVSTACGARCPEHSGRGRSRQRDLERVVRSLAAIEAVERAVRSTPGVAHTENRLVVRSSWKATGS